jgi:hypothetical protein
MPMIASTVYSGSVSFQSVSVDVVALPDTDSSDSDNDSCPDGSVDEASEEVDDDSPEDWRDFI